MSAHWAVLSLGSNLGDRLAHLQGALDGLAARGVDVVVVSGVYETAPVGGPDQGSFLNAVAIADTDLDPLELLTTCQQVEADHDRLREVRWGPRTLDVDVIDVEGVTSDAEILTLPHPRAVERAFVCVPWLDADPQATIEGRPVSNVVDELDRSGVYLREDLSLSLPGRTRA